MNAMTTYIDKYDNNKFIKQYPDYIHAHGGDGTLIRAVAMHKEKGKPFFGSAAGTVNFMMNPEKEISENAEVLDLYTINVEITYQEKKKVKTETYEAFNELALGGDMNAWITFNTEDDFIEEFKGGGIVISTTQGSTSLSKNNGGRVLPLTSEEWVITGDKTNRVINHVIEPRTLTFNVKARTSVTAWVDGANNKIISNVISVTIKKGRKIQLIFNDLEAFKKKRI